MSVDLCFWESSDGDAGELYEDAAEGIDHTFAASTRVLEFRAGLLRRWPDLTDSVEPPEFDHELEAPSDLSRYVLVTVHASKSDRIPAMIDAGVLVDAAGSVGSSAVAEGDAAALEVAKELVPFDVGGGAVFLT